MQLRRRGAEDQREQTVLRYHAVGTNKWEMHAHRCRTREERFQMWYVVVDSPGKATSSEPPWHYAATPRLVQAKSPHVVAVVSNRWCTEVRGALCVAWDPRETDNHSVSVSLAELDTYRYTFDDSESHAKGCDS